MSEQNLKICPFCGSQAEIGYHAGTEVYPQSYWTKCSKCECTSPSYFGSSTWERDSGDNDRAKQKAADWWNRRHDAMTDLLEALRNMDESMCRGFDTRADRDFGRKSLVAARAAIAKATGSQS